MSSSQSGRLVHKNTSELEKEDEDNKVNHQVDVLVIGRPPAGGMIVLKVV